jgi:hypothetical protein
MASLELAPTILAAMESPMPFDQSETEIDIEFSLAKIKLVDIEFGDEQ